MNLYLLGMIEFIVFIIAVYGIYILYKDRSAYDSVPACMLLIIVVMFSTQIVSDINEPTLPAYQAGYNDYPDNATYNKIIELENPPLELRHYKNGWEQAKADYIKLKIENDIN